MINFTKRIKILLNKQPTREYSNKCCKVGESLSRKEAQNYINDLNHRAYFGNSDAKYDLGMLHYYGGYTEYGVERDINKAVKMLNSSAFNGNSNAKRFLNIYTKNKTLSNKGDQFFEG